uniref:Uncharacterized protein n=1 Tax=uncultured prokaryote TaxID=198431 RepID=A0A0H5Q3I7_9ZZZZ|nr:hypothetical protein [uncultured prokaryote]
MALYRAQLIFNMLDGIPRNASTNTLYFDADSDLVLPQIDVALENMLLPIDGLLSSLIDASNIRCDYYRMSDPTPRQVVYSGAITGLTMSTTAGPTEVAFVVSYQAARVSGLPQARRRGRFYLGPLEAQDTARPDAGQVTAVKNAAGSLLTASNAATEWTWAQYSPTNGVGTNVDNGWVDDEWDTQRRRGRTATYRETFS